MRRKEVGNILNCTVDVDESRFKQFAKTGNMYERIENEMGITKRAWKDCRNSEIYGGSFVETADLDDENMWDDKEDQFESREMKHSKYPSQVVELCDEINLTTNNPSGMDVVQLKKDIFIPGDSRRDIVQEQEEIDGLNEMAETTNDSSEEKRKIRVRGRPRVFKNKKRS